MNDHHEQAKHWLAIAIDKVPCEYWAKGCAVKGGPVSRYWCSVCLMAEVERLRDLLSQAWTDDEPTRCDKCGAVCDLRVQVCECTPDCPYPPVAR